MNCIRLLFCVYNFIFIIIGGAVLGFGIWVAADPRFAEHLEKLVETADKDKLNDTIIGLLKNSGYVLMSFGGVVFFLSFLGYCGAVKQSRFLLGVYTLLLGIILILEIVTLILILAVFGPKFEQETQAFLRDKLKSQYVYPEQNDFAGEDRTFARTLDGIMVKFQCCGITNYTDFLGVTPAPQDPQGTKVPKTCCKCEDETLCKELPDFPTTEQIQRINFKQCGTSPESTDSNGRNGGCYAKLREKVLSVERIATLVGVGIIIGLLQLLGIIFGVYTYKKSYNS